MSLPQLERETSRLNEVKCVKDFQTRRLIYFLSSLPTAASSSEGVVLVLFLLQLFFYLFIVRLVPLFPFRVSFEGEKAGFDARSYVFEQTRA